MGTIDTSFALDIEQQKSVTGYTFFLAKAAVYCKCKLQTSIATSTTELEFIAAITSAKTALYLRSILTDLDIPQSNPTPIYADNITAVHMANHNRLTLRTRHINIS